MAKSLRQALVVAGVVIVGFLLLMTGPGRTPLIRPYPGANVSALFPDDIIAVDGPDDHGWWDYTMNPGSERDPDELCEAVLDAMLERAWGLPGIGVVIGVPPSDNPADYVPRDIILPDGSRAVAEGKPNPHGPWWHAYCGRPDWLGLDPRGQWRSP
jgi:hypothetical protein